MASDASHRPPDGIPQFDEAPLAVGAPVLPTCLECGTRIHSVYYERDGVVLCSACKSVAEKKLGTPSAAFRRALLFGLGGAAVCAGIWLAVLIATDSTYGILAIVVGLVVGGAVKAGARGRGGRRYQVLAALLTYLAIGASYVPLFINAAIKAESSHTGSRRSSSAPDVSVVPATPASPARADSADATPAAAAEQRETPESGASADVASGVSVTPHLTEAEEAADDSASAAAALSASEEARRMAARRESKIPGPAIVRIPLALLIVVVGLLLMALVSPLVLAFADLPGSLITFLITAIAVNIAWKATAGSSIRLTGPYKVGVPRAGDSRAA